MENLSLAVIAFAIITFGLFSALLYRSDISPAMAFTAFGFIIGPSALNLLTVDLESHFIHSLAEVTLAVVLFTDATRIDTRLLWREHDIPARLLGVGLPLTVAAGALAGLALFPQMDIWQAAVLAVILAPTDAALGLAVVNSPKVPVRIRQSLNVESGLNDGVALPFFMILFSLAEIKGDPGSAQSWMRFAAMQIGFGAMAGLAIGYCGGKSVEFCSERRWMTPEFQRISAIALALLAFAAANEIGGNGFIAAFCGGLTMRLHRHSICHRMQEFGEAEGQALALLIFMLFGGLMISISFDSMDWRVALYAALSLTVVRMIPVAISLVGKGLSAKTVVFVGWFGPRGIASILFALVILRDAHLPMQQQIMDTIFFTVLMSVMAHGLTANPAVQWYSKHTGELDPQASEHMKVTEIPSRIHHGANHAQ